MPKSTKPKARRSAPRRKPQAIFAPREPSVVLLELHRAVSALLYAFGSREGFPVAAFARDYLHALERLGMAGTPAAAFLNELRAGERDKNEMAR
jgi:hypothetical protein